MLKDKKGQQKLTINYKYAVTDSGK